MVCRGKEAKLFDEAIALANRGPCDPKTLTRAARDFAEQNPAFATEAGLAALHWLVQGYGYEVTNADVWAACSTTIKAAENAGRGDEVRCRVGRWSTTNNRQTASSLTSFVEHRGFP